MIKKPICSIDQEIKNVLGYGDIKVLDIYYSRTTEGDFCYLVTDDSDNQWLVFEGELILEGLT